MVSCLQCGRSWPDDERGRNNLAKHKFRNIAPDGTLTCISKETKKMSQMKVAQIRKTINTLERVEDIENGFEKINELEVQLKLKSEENEELKCKEFQGCKLPASIIARRSMTEPERRLILEKQGNKCAGVNCKLSSLSGYAYDIDHKVPIQFGGNNDECNLQALCTECHRNKTDFERTLKTILEKGGNETVVLPDAWPHLISHALYSKHITSPIVIYAS